MAEPSMDPVILITFEARAGELALRSPDPELQRRVITLESPYGTVTLTCDDVGQLSSIEIN